MTILKRYLWAFLIGIPVSLYTTFIIQLLWNWFVAPAFHIPEISFWGTYGMVLLAGVLIEGQRGGDRLADEQRWKNIAHALEACIPEEKREQVVEAMSREEDALWVTVGSKVFGLVVGNTVALLIGWGVHAFLT
jgi:hypothetical protein